MTAQPVSREMVRRYEQSDAPELAAWYRARGQPVPDADMVPKVGFIEPGVAVGFLMQTDAPAICLVHGFVTDPHVPAMKRGRAVAAILRALIAFAEALGCKRLVGFTQWRGMAQASMRAGFHSRGTLGQFVRGI